MGVEVVLKKGQVWSDLGFGQRDGGAGVPLLHLGPTDRLEWIMDNNNIRVVPVRANPIHAFRGQGKGGATARLLASRKRDLAQE